MLQILRNENIWAKKPKKLPEVFAPLEAQVVLSHLEAFEETQLRNRVKGMGGRWNPNLKAWQLPYGIVLKMKLEERIIKDI